MTTGFREEQLRKYCQRVDAAVASERLTRDAAENLKRWLTEPQYHEYLGRLTELIDHSEFEQLETLFWEVVPFGTGGRRGRMGALGCATINRRTIAESAHGLAEHLKATKSPETGGSAVVAYDSRNRSPEFANVTATTLAAHGLKVYLFDSIRATPELSFAVRHLNCDIGVMISASHNPPSDNGFKAYWNTGGQVLHPDDQAIIACVNAAGTIPTIDFDQAVQESKIEMIGDAVDQAYIDAVVRLSLSPQRNIRALFTPLHGVGETSVFRALRQAGFAGVELFELQSKPDGQFPNVPDHLPNPERVEVFEPAIQLARQSGHDLILASDPDADRMAVAVKCAGGEFVCLTGNQLGSLLTDYILRKREAAGTLTPDHYVVETLVTTPMVAAIARAHGVQAVDDLLVGFKYIGQTMDQKGPEQFVFGVEESLGYLAGSYCRDKDAAIAALYVLELAAELREEGKTLVDHLDTLYAEYGYFVESQTSVFCEGSSGREQIQRLMARLRHAPPTNLAGNTFSRVRDYGQHEIRRLPENEKLENLPEPDGELLIFESTAPDHSVMFATRPSGTEPKIKFYLFGWSDCEATDQLEKIRHTTNRAQQELKQALSDWITQVLSEEK